jgi:hypothetical protein
MTSKKAIEGAIRLQQVQKLKALRKKDPLTWKLSDFKGIDLNDLSPKEYKHFRDMLFSGEYVDDSVGDVSEIGYWYGKVDLKGTNIMDCGDKVVGAIISEDDYERRDITIYTDEKDFEDVWKKIAEDVEKYVEEYE